MQVSYYVSALNNRNDLLLLLEQINICTFVVDEQFVACRTFFILTVLLLRAMCF